MYIKVKQIKIIKHQDKLTYVILVDEVEVHLDRLGGISVLLKEKVSFVLDSGDEDMIGFIKYGESTWIDEIDVSNVHVSTPEEINKLKEALKEDGTYETFFE